MDPFIRRAMWQLENYDTPEKLIMLWTVYGSWNSSDLPLVENDFPWYNIKL